MYHPKNEDTLAFFLTVYHVTQQIPKGRVTTYGHLAYLAGKPNNSRQAGQALKFVPRSETPAYNVYNVPWWRVVNATGGVSQIENRDLQHKYLKEELGKENPPYTLSRYGWFPEPEEVDLDFVSPS